MSKKILTKKRVKKISKLLGNPTIKYILAGGVGMVAYKTIRSLETKYPVLGELIDRQVTKLKDVTFHDEDQKAA
ncbi:MAG TPA: hypothetical protein VNJ08_04245 [Bacteriovoracaceae bacterium]|nr:hypothetical protein [Bacteriovoracaceae bacterium]